MSLPGNLLRGLMMTNNVNSAPENGPDPPEEEPERFLVRGGDREALSIDQALSLLSDQRRRMVLRELRGSPSTACDLKTLVTRIARMETELSDGSLTDDIKESVHLSLTHQHLPMLEGAGVVEYNSEAELIHYTGDPVLEMYLDVTDELENW